MKYEEHKCEEEGRCRCGVWKCWGDATLITIKKNRT